MNHQKCVMLIIHTCIFFQDRTQGRHSGLLGKQAKHEAMITCAFPKSEFSH